MCFDSCHLQQQWVIYFKIYWNAKCKILIFRYIRIALEDGILKKYLDAARDLTFEERGKLLESDEPFAAAHRNLALEGPPPTHDDGSENHHFVALVQKDGELYELDGRKSFPIKHGSTSNETFLEVNLIFSFSIILCLKIFLQDAANVCKEFIARDPDEIRFTVSAIAPTSKDC